jgi:hypothetical protein
VAVKLTKLKRFLHEKQERNLVIIKRFWSFVLSCMTPYHLCLCQVFHFWHTIFQ